MKIQFEVDELQVKGVIASQHRNMLLVVTWLTIRQNEFVKLWCFTSESQIFRRSGLNNTVASVSKLWILLNLNTIKFYDHKGDSYSLSEIPPKDEYLNQTFACDRRLKIQKVRFDWYLIFDPLTERLIWFKRPVNT